MHPTAYKKKNECQRDNLHRREPLLGIHRVCKQVKKLGRIGEMAQ